jgi:shikimate kinase
MNIILCGMPMCGKTTVGKRIARHLQRPFLDTDKLIEEAYHKQTGQRVLCREIYLREGPQFFRQLESQQITSLQNSSAAIIALGGGSLSNPENSKTISSLGHLIYIKTPTEILWKRMISKGISPYLDQSDPRKSFAALAKSRETDYATAAAVTIEAKNFAPKILVEMILKATTHT